MSTVNNADLWTVTFLDANDVAATPSSVVTWQVERNRRILTTAGAIIPADEEQVTTTVLANTEVTTGVYELSFTPVRAGEYSVKAWATVGGEMQAVPATMLEVER